MERILRESDEGILIYVAPTKALVMQVVCCFSFDNSRLFLNPL